jgi:pimeloyl-ACP methyl ester carboxylesterase
MVRNRPRRHDRSRRDVRLRLTHARLWLLARVAPKAAGAAAERLFFTPPPPRHSRGTGVLRKAKRLELVVDGRRVVAFRWGSGPAIALLHGWGGRAAQLTSFVEPIVSRGFSAVALDAPGHGESERGMSSAPQFARALRAAAEAIGGLHGAVAHSLGAAAVALAMRDGLHLSRVVMLGAAAEPPSWVDRFAARFGLPATVVDEMRQRSERRIGTSWRELSVPALARELTASLLVVHDRDDADVAIEDAIRIASAWPGAVLLETNGLGHNGVLRDPAVVARVAEFVTAGPEDRCSCGAPVAPGRECEACRVARELFDREERWEAANV